MTSHPDSLKNIVNHQAEIETLWLMHPTITEHLLISALRHLHAAIEGDQELAEFYKNEYWEVETDL